MMTKFFLAITLIVGCIFVGCKRHAANTELNVFYNVTHQAETFGFTLETFHQLQIAFKQNKSPDFKQAFYYYNYGCGYYHTNKRDELTALKYADSMLLVCDQANTATDQAEIAIANLSEGDILFALKRYNEALEYYYNGKMAANKSGDQYTLSEYSYRIGMAMYRKENYDTAAKYFIDAFEQGGYRKNSFSDFYRRQEVLDNAALSYLHSGRQDSAIWFCKKGLQYLADNANRYADKGELIQVAQGVLYGTMGKAYLKLHDTAGIGLLQKSIAINQLPGRENVDALQAQAFLAQYYLDTTSALQLPKAYSMLIAIQRGLDTLYNDDVAVKWNGLMSRYNALQGNTAAAYTYLVRRNALHEKQVASKKKLTETNISSQLKLMQDRYDMRLLKTNNQLKTIYLSIAIVVLLLGGYIFFLIMGNWKREKKNSLVLLSLNEQIEQQKTMLQTTVKQLDEQVKTKDYILRVLAHDLRNPISAISTLTRIVHEEYENEEENKEFLHLAQTACKDSLTMIDSIMQLSQHDSPESLKRSVIDVNEIVMECVIMQRLKAEEKQQEIVLHTAKTPQYTFADSERIIRVVNNLLTNAIKFSFPNSTIHVSVKDDNEHVEIEVKDDGIGIPPDMQDKVFDVFTEARRKGTSKEGTFGLGLSICKQLVEAHDGKIWLESREGLGSAFHVQLSRHLVSQSELEADVVDEVSYNEQVTSVKIKYIASDVES